MTNNPAPFVVQTGINSGAVTPPVFVQRINHFGAVTEPLFVWISSSPAHFSECRYDTVIFIMIDRLHYQSDALIFDLFRLGFIVKIPVRALRFSSLRVHIRFLIALLLFSQQHRASWP